MGAHARTRTRPAARRARRYGRAKAALSSFALAAALTPLFPTHPGMPAPPTRAELQAALGAELQTLSVFAEDGDDLGDGAGSMDGPGAPLFIRDANARIPAERGGRVAPTRLAAVQPKFVAGRLVDPAGLLRAGIAIGDEEMRTALAGPRPPGEPIRVAGVFTTPAAKSKILGKARAEAPVLVAAAMPTPRAANAPREPAAPPETAATAVAAYASDERPGLSTLFDPILGPSRGFKPPIGRKDHSWAASLLPPSSYTPAEQKCLATGIYFEARGESELGQAAVAQVILNRVRNPAYPKTICGVVYQNQDWHNRCQFSFACDGIKDVIRNKPAYETAERIAREVTNGETWLPEVGSATHYHATYVRPRWARTMEKVDKIGLHIFYRTFGGGWR